MSCHSREGGNPVIANEKSKEDNDVAMRLLGPRLRGDDAGTGKNLQRLV